MDIATLLIGVVIIAACALPFVLSGVSRRCKEKKLICALNALADSVSAKIDDFEMYCNTAVAIDVDGKNLFFVRFVDEKTVETVDLTKVKSCSLVEKRHNSDTVPDTMGLNFVFVDGGPELFLEFFNSDIDVTSDGISPILSRWNVKINNRLAH